MGLLSRRNIIKTSRPPTTSFPYLLIPISFILFAILFLFQVDSFISRTKTIAGHNLEPTPWHLFPPKFNQESKYSIASKIIQCSYLACGSDNGNTTIDNIKDQLPNRRSGEEELSSSTTSSCPEFFKYIHQDLQPWAKTKITQAHIMEAQKFATFRVVILGGKLYVDFYYACVQSRAMFTVWGLLQLLRRYPGKIPDVDFMFECMDKPTINRTEHSGMPLPLFRYCTTPEHYDIPFPDWSFWGWAETNISPWDQEFKSIKEGSGGVGWRNRIPLAYWKGNPDVGSPIREALLQCNDTNMWRAQILIQDWEAEAKRGFKESKLSNQCNHRYKIYAEGYAWSVSLKYILSCGSLPLIVTPQYEDFFGRGLVPRRNYWHIPPSHLCASIRSAVDWFNAHPSQAEAIGRNAQGFMESLSMDRVYDYMFHLLTEYSKLQDFAPFPPPSAVEICMDSVLCFAKDKQKQLLIQSSVLFPPPSTISPCTLPPPDLNLFDSKRKSINTP